MVVKLKDPKAEWDDRVDFLVQFQGACLAGAPTIFESFTTQLQKLKEPIANQVRFSINL
jgi:hypothetical protein